MKSNSIISSLRISLQRYVQPITILWLLLITLMVFLCFRGISLLGEVILQNNPEPVIKAMQVQVNELSQQFTDIQKQTVTQQNLKKVQENINQQLEKINQRISIIDVQGLEAEVARLDEANKQLTVTVEILQKNAETATATKKIPEQKPPFTVVGTEPEQKHITVLPDNHQTLSEARILKPGESFKQWTLQSINKQEAVFMIKGKKRVIRLQ